MDSIQAKQNAIIYFRQGFTCAQSVVMAFAEYKSIDAQQLVKAAGAFGSGLNAGCVCGSLAGAEMLVGLIYTKDKKITKEKSKKLHDAFKASFGATCCRCIKGKENRMCEKTIERAMEILDEVTK